MVSGMNTWVVGAVIAALLTIGAAGYLGYRSVVTAQGQAEAPQAPATIPVTRGTIQQTVSAPGTLAGTREALLNLPVSGQVLEIAVRVGERVAAGATLIELDTAELEENEQQQRLTYLQAQLTYSQTIQGPDPADVQAAQAALISAQAAYTALISPPSANEVAQLEAALRNAEASLKDAQMSYESSLDRAAATLVLEQAQNNYNAAQAAYDQAFEAPDAATLGEAQAQIAEAQAQVANLEPDPVEITQATLQMEQALADWEHTKDDLQQAILTAPFDGVVLEIKSRVGERVDANAPLILFADPTALEVEAKAVEEDLPLVEIGQEVEVYFDAVPEAIVRGHVTRINPLRLEGDRPLYGVYISLDEIPAGVVAGMTVDAAIVIEHREDVLQLPRALVRASATNKSSVEVWANGQRQRREITVGLRGDVYVEIVDGLAEGDAVVSQ